MLEARDFYRIENMVRSPLSRVQRQGAATRHRAALWILGRRVLPKVPLLLTKKEFDANKQTLLADVKLGKIAIVRPDQVRIDSTDDGALIYYPPGKPATREDPTAEVTKGEDEGGEEIVNDDGADEGAEKAGLELAEDTANEPSGEVATPASEAETQELPTSEVPLSLAEEAKVVFTPSEVAVEVVTEVPAEVPVEAASEVQEVTPAEETTTGLLPSLESVYPEAETPPAVVEKPIELDTTPQDETPPEIEPEPEGEAKAPERKSRKKKGKNHE